MPSNLIVKDGNGNSQTLVVYANGTASAANSAPVTLSTEDKAILGNTVTNQGIIVGYIDEIESALTQLQTTLDVMPPAGGQQTMANSLSVVIASNQSDLQINVVSSVLPSGSATATKQDDIITQLVDISANLAANVVVLPPSPLMSNGSVLSVYTFDEARISANASGNTTLVAANSGVTTKVYRLIIQASNTSTNNVAVELRNGANALIQWNFSNGAGVVLNFNEHPWFTTGSNTDLVLNLSANATIEGRLYYVRN